MKTKKNICLILISILQVYVLYLRIFFVFTCIYFLYPDHCTNNCISFDICYALCLSVLQCVGTRCPVVKEIVPYPHCWPESMDRLRCVYEGTFFVKLNNFGIILAII